MILISKSSFTETRNSPHSLVCVKSHIQQTWLKPCSHHQLVHFNILQLINGLSKLCQFLRSRFALYHLKWIKLLLQSQPVRKKLDHKMIQVWPTSPSQSSPYRLPFGLICETQDIIILGLMHHLGLLCLC